MANHLSENDVRGISEYTRIGVEESEISQLTRELNSIIDELEPLLQYDLEGVEPIFHPIGDLVNVSRADVAGDSFTQEEALANAAAAQDGCFLIPSILGEGGDR